MNNKKNAGFMHIAATVTAGQTYLNVAYLLVAFPLGLAYFVLIATGLILGIGLLPIMVGVPILLATLTGAHGLALLEAHMTNTFLGTAIRAQTNVRQPVAWRTLAYLFIKLPFGFVASTVAGAGVFLTVLLVSAPLTYHTLNLQVGMATVDSLPKALYCVAAGLVIGVTTLYMTNLLADVWRTIAAELLHHDEVVAVDQRRATLTLEPVTA